MILTATAAAQMTNPGALQRVFLSPGQPLVLVDSVVSDLRCLLVTPDKIQSLDILKDSNTLAHYGPGARYGVIIVRMKESVNLITLDELLAQFSIPERDRNLPVCINNILAEEKDKLLADTAYIEKVEVVTDRYWYSPNHAGPVERHIDIITRRAVLTGQK